jgi:3-oxo-5-alpha-steroid 4-dehydrogenase 1
VTWYTGNPHYDTVLTFAFGIAAVAGVAGIFVQSPYGRFADSRYGVGLDPRLGWFLMELPAPVAFLYFYFQGPLRDQPFAVFVLCVWLVHYANRGFLMPALMRVPQGQRTSFSVMVVVIGWVVTSLHGYLNAVWASALAPQALTGFAWFSDPRFVFGVLLYAVGLVANVRSDHIVRGLRTKEEIEQGIKRYRIPRGGLFEYVTSASYLTEIVAWAGFAIFTWSLAGVFILVVSLANLVPRAIATHRWYHEKFPDYPRGRKILIPFVW